MQNKIFILSMAIGLTISVNAEVDISISGYGQHDIKDVSVSTDDRGNTNYIYVDKGSHIVDSTIGSTIVTNHQFTKEEGIRYYNRKINRYQDKIETYHNKIDNYHDKISQKPHKRERYQNKIEHYKDKINEYRKKITEARIKLKKYHNMR